MFLFPPSLIFGPRLPRELFALLFSPARRFPLRCLPASRTFPFSLGVLIPSMVVPKSLSSGVTVKQTYLLQLSPSLAHVAGKYLSILPVPRSRVRPLFCLFFTLFPPMRALMHTLSVCSPFCRGVKWWQLLFFLTIRPRAPPIRYAYIPFLRFFSSFFTA